MQTLTDATRRTQAQAPTYRLLGCTIDGSQHFVLELGTDAGECFVDLAVTTYDDGRGAQLDRTEVVCTQSWTCAAPSAEAAAAWVKANHGSVEDAVFDALDEARS